MSDTVKKRVAVIGAGVSGLPCIKSCLEEGFEVVCFEKTDDIGGLWNYRERYTDISTVMKSTIVNTSKEMMCYSDFPPDPQDPNFWHNTVLLKYLNQYADHFKLRQHIRLNATVKSLRQAPDYAKTGRWAIQASDSEEEEIFDSVMVASGHHMNRHVPWVDGVEEFQGWILHSQQYRDSVGYEGKKVLVVGIGNSGLDIAVELSRVAEQVYLSTRRGTWIWNRVSKRGYPYDVWYFSRFLEFARFKIFGLHLASKYFSHLINMRMDHAMYGLRPAHEFFQQHPAVNDQLPNCICSGRVVIKTDVRKFSGPKTVQFVDDSEVDLDAVVLCTGYTFGFPFLEPQDLIPVRQNRVDLYKSVFPPNLAHPSLAVIGFIQPIGSIQPISEMQSRWAAKIFKGELGIPAEPEMRMEIIQRVKEIKDRYFDSPKHTIQVDYVPYMEDLASKIGAKPNYVRLLFSDPKLFYHVIFGPCTPYTYRLVGPQAWKKARDAILTTQDRVSKPLRTRNCAQKPETSQGKLVLYTARSLGLIMFVLLYLTVWYSLLTPPSLGAFVAWTVGFLFSVVVFVLVYDSYFDLSTLF